MIAEPSGQQPDADPQRECHSAGRVAKPAPAGASPRFFEQRLETSAAGRASGNEASITSTMLRVKVDRGEDRELHEQVAAELRRAIADGEAGPGDRLPPARDLAAVLGVNTNTVLRALRTLRDEGLLDFRRGRGITVSDRPERGAVVARARELVAFAREHGYRREELIDIIEAFG
jgi:GntR family transcriptional regulator